MVQRDTFKDSCRRISVNERDGSKFTVAMMARSSSLDVDDGLPVLAASAILFSYLYAFTIRSTDAPAQPISAAISRRDFPPMAKPIIRSLVSLLILRILIPQTTGTKTHPPVSCLYIVKYSSYQNPIGRKRRRLRAQGMRVSFAYRTAFAAFSARCYRVSFIKGRWF